MAIAGGALLGLGVESNTMTEGAIDGVVSMSKKDLKSFFFFVLLDLFELLLLELL